MSILEIIGLVTVIGITLLVLDHINFTDSWLFKKVSATGAKVATLTGWVLGFVTIASISVLYLYFIGRF